MKKIVIIISIICIGLVGFAIGELRHFDNNKESHSEINTPDESDTSIIVDDDTINLNNYDTDIVLSQAKEYTISGNLNHAIFIKTDTNEDSPVTLLLNSVNINSAKSAIVSETNNLILKTTKKSKNNITSYGDDAITIKTSGLLTIDGEGEMTVWNQNPNTTGGPAIYAKNLLINNGELVAIGGSGERGSGISTEEKYTIVGGDVTISGMDMLEPPAPESSAESAVFSLDRVYDAGSVVKITNSRGVTAGYYVARNNFRTVVFSNHLVQTGSYTLHINDEYIKTVEVK